LPRWRQDFPREQLGSTHPAEGQSTVTIVRVGATKKYSDGWESAFGKGKKATSANGTGKKAAASTKKKSAGKKKGKKK
jgi:hypothetical protein